ncbi:MAG: hypothetical protein JXN10_08035 [Clostridia bacterium]|nr:hypothetical protein [Clostridia bacterium]
MIDLNSYNEILESYNLEIQMKFEDAMQYVSNPGDYALLMKEARLQWEKKYIGTKTPEEYFKDVMPEDLIALFKRASVVCDEFIPQSLALRIINEVESDDIVELAKNSDIIEVRTAAIELLGLSGNPMLSDSLMDLLYDESEYSDLVAEKARKALVELGPGSKEYLEKRIAEITSPAGNDFHLIIALIEINTGKKSDSTYLALKEVFHKTEEKALAARCLADYGDGRAVTLLRGYLYKNQDKTDPETILEIQGSILNLGGSLEGLG